MNLLVLLAFLTSQGSPVTLTSATADKTAVRAGDVVRVQVKLAIEDPYHLYAMISSITPATVELKSQGVELAGKIEESAPKTIDVSGESHPVHEVEAVFTIPLRIRRVAPGPLDINGRITGQACTKAVCTGVDVPFAVRLTVGAAAPKKAVVEIRSVTAEPSEARPGDLVTLTIEVKIEEPWHLYSIGSDPAKTKPTRFEFDKDALVETVGAVKESTPKMISEIPAHEGQAEFRVPVRVRAGTGKTTIRGRLIGQACTNVCKDITLPFETSLQIAGARQDPEVRLVSLKSDPERVLVGDVATLKLELLVTPDEFKKVPGSASVSLDPPLAVESVRDTETGIAVAVRIKETPSGRNVEVRGKLRLKISNGKEIELTVTGLLDILRPTIRIVSQGVDRPEVRVGGRFTYAVKFAIDPPGFKPVADSARALFEGPFEAGLIRETPDGFSILVRVKDEARPSAANLKGKLTLRLSDGREPVDVSADLAGALKLLEPPAPSPSQQDPLSRGLIPFLGLCVAGGLISLIMPCVYPLLPITLTFFLKQSAGTRSKSFVLALLYGLGIIVTFTGLGFALSLALGAAGAQTLAANPWVNLVIGILFFALALSLVGMFEIRLPSFLTDRVAGAAPKQGYLGAFGLGLVFTVVTFTCTIPIAASLLAMAASGRGGSAFLGMLAYSTTMAVPFFVLGLFPVLLKKIPKSGGWLQTVKVGAGFLELALAVYYLSKSDYSFGVHFISRELALALWIAIMLAAAAWLLGLWRFKDDEKTEHVGYGRALWAIAFATFSFYLLSGLSGSHLGRFESLLPPSARTASAGPKPENGGQAIKPLRIFESLEEGLEVARKEGKPLFLEFTAFT